MQNGISIYPGLDNTLSENLALIETAAALGLPRLFTSLHIPETDPSALKRELGVLLKAARAHHMEIISDVSPATLTLLGLKEFNLSAFRMLGITTLRLDDGFTCEDIARLSHNSQHIRLQLNASTMTGRLLQKLVDAKTDFSSIDALHNFYPRTGTGLSEETLARKTAMLHKAGIRVGAFLPSLAGRRLLQGTILPEHTAERPCGAVTIDNSGYGRYMGELEIIKNGQPADPRVNVAAHVKESDRFLIDYISPGRRFSLFFPA